MIIGSYERRESKRHSLVTRAASEARGFVIHELALPAATLLPHSGTPYVFMVLGGFVLGILGYMSSSRTLVVVGIGLIVLGALLFPVAINLTESTPPQVHEPR
jgi:hypothetical protein